MRLNDIEIEETYRIGKKNVGDRLKRAQEEEEEQTGEEENRHDIGKEKGKQEDRPRPLIVKFKDTRMKWDVMKNVKKLKYMNKPGFSKMSIVPDLTRKEREVDRELRMEIKDRREKGEVGLYIHKGKICKRNFH